MCFYIHWFFVTVALFSRSRFVIVPFFCFSCYFLSRLCEERDQGYGINTQSGSQMQQLNAGNQGKNIKESMGVFSGGSYGSIGQNSSFLYSTAPT